MAEFRGCAQQCSVQLEACSWQCSPAVQSCSGSSVTWVSGAESTLSKSDDAQVRGVADTLEAMLPFS